MFTKLRRLESKQTISDRPGICQWHFVELVPETPCVQIVNFTRQRIEIDDQTHVPVTGSGSKVFDSIRHVDPHLPRTAVFPAE